MKYIVHPHIPERTVKVCAVGAGQPQLVHALEMRGIQVVVLLADSRLAKPVQSHTDLLLHHAGGERLWVAAPDCNSTSIATLAKFGFNISSIHKPLENQYPHDVPLCCFSLKDYLICKMSSVDQLLLKYYQSLRKNIIAVNQGYTKCSCCIVDKNSVITSDAALANKLTTSGIEVLKISIGYIDLPGYNYGFIGGCSGLISENELVFYGNILEHPDYDAIETFCSQRNIEVTSLCTQQRLTDIGGIIPLMESEDMC